MAAFDPAGYEAWYHTPRGRWISDTEFTVLMRLLRPVPGQTLLDVGCGTGHFSRRFAAAGLAVTGIDPDAAMLRYARAQAGAVVYLRGDARTLPFADHAFDHCAAVTSLCFIADPAGAVREMLRVCRGCVVLGLLNRRSLLHRLKCGRGGYRGARWDERRSVRRWLDALDAPVDVAFRTAVFFPGGTPAARIAERLLPHRLPWGGFLAVRIGPTAC